VTTGFPIVTHIDLPPVIGRVFRKRDTAKFPTLRPHQVMVIATQGRFLEIVPGTLLDPRDRELIDATGITIVDVGQHVVPIAIDLASHDPSESFAVAVSFSCKVLSPSTVVKEMFDGIDGPLEHWLGAQLRKLASGFEAADLASFQGATRALLKAETDLTPIHLPGLRIDVNVESVDIRPPVAEAQVRERLARRRRDHVETMETISLASEGDLAKEMARQSLQRLVGSFDDEHVATLLRAFKEGPDAVNARRVVTGEATLTRISEEQRADRRFLTAALADVFNKLVDSGQFDQSQVGDELGEQLLGQLLQSLKALGSGAGFGEPIAGNVDSELTDGQSEEGRFKPDAGA
jgi:hypothetical protein